MPEGAARAGFTAFDLMDSWLTASRQMMDLWRTAVREQQDCMLAAFRQHVANAAPDELVDELSDSARPTNRPARTTSRQDEPAHTHH
jgi:hypothetical protein